MNKPLTHRQWHLELQAIEETLADRLPEGHHLEERWSKARAEMEDVYGPDPGGPNCNWEGDE